jgi:hypothetical protein
VGVLLYFLVTGQYPVEGQTLTDLAVAHALGHRRLLADARSGLNDGFVRVVERALAGAPEHRYRSAGAMMRDLADITPGGTAARSYRDDERRTSGATAPAGVLDTRVPGAWDLPAASAVRWLAIAGVAVVTIWLLGFLTSTAFDWALGRAEFSTDSPLKWFTWGVRSLWGPASLVALALVAGAILRSIVQAARGLVRRRRHPAAATPRTGAASAWWSGGEPATQAQWLLVAQVASVAVTCWIFQDFIEAFSSTLDTAPAGVLMTLSGDSDAQVLYRLSLSLLLLAMALAWRHVLGRRSEAGPVDRVTAVGGFAVMAIVLVLITVPFRLVYANNFPQVTYDHVSCNVIGQNDDTLLLFCPSLMPRNRIVMKSEPTLRRSGGSSSIFPAAVSPSSTH